MDYMDMPDMPGFGITDEIRAAIDGRLQCTTTERLEGLHLALTVAAGGYDCDTSDAEADTQARHDPHPAPAWLWEALSESVTRLGYELAEEDAPEGAPLGTARTMWTPFGPVPHSIVIAAGMSEASRCRMLCHEMAHVLAPPLRTPDSIEDAHAINDVSECIAEGAAALVMTTLGASGGRFSIRKEARASLTPESFPYGDVTVMEHTRPHAVILAGQILFCVQQWQDWQAAQLVASLEQAAS